ncbi:hypothetical protein SLA2020_283690 [Shorea laevis]
MREGKEGVGASGNGMSIKSLWLLRRNAAQGMVADWSDLLYSVRKDRSGRRLSYLGLGASELSLYHEALDFEEDGACIMGLRQELDWVT